MTTMSTGHSGVTSPVLPTDEQATRLESWRFSTFLVVLFGYVGYYVGRANLPVAMPLLSQEFGYSNTDLGIILTMSELAYALGKFTTGPLADRVGGKVIFLVGLIGAIVFNLAFPMFSTLTLFTVVWCFCRYFLAMGWGGVIKLIGEWYEPERHGTIMGIVSINFQFGSVAATLFCAFLLQKGVGWKGLFFYPALVMMAIALWSYLASKESPQKIVPGVRFGGNASERKAMAQIEHGEDGRASWAQMVKSLLRLPMFRQLLVFSFLSHILRSIFMYWTPKFLVDIGMGHVGAAMSSAVFPLLGCLGTIFIGWYTDNYAKNGDRARMMWIMLVGLTVCLLAIAQLTTHRLEYQYLLILFLGLGGFFMYGPYSMSAGALSLDIAGAKAAGTCTGLIDSVGYLGSALAAWAAGVMSDKVGWAQVFLALAGCSLLSVLSAYNLSRTLRKRA